MKSPSKTMRKPKTCAGRQSWLQKMLGLCAGLAVGCHPLSAPSEVKAFELQLGDLLFQDLDCGPFCEAIEAVTQGIGGAKLSHVGMVVELGAQPIVIEAYAQGVALVPLEDFLSRSADEKGRPKVLVGRLCPAFDHLVPAAVSAARERLGKPYDESFRLDNDAYYCSELLYEAFKQAQGGKSLFELVPMTFRDPKTGQFDLAWAAHFEKRGEPIPEAEPGLNPGSMSMSPALTIVHAFGSPAGWNQEIDSQSND